MFRFETLEVWQMARAYAGRVYVLTARFPRHEDYGLRSQMNRAVNSIGLNIAEGTGKSSGKALDYHLEIAIGSTYEIIGASFLALDRGYISEEEQRTLYAEGERLARGIGALRKALIKPDPASHKP